jgi:hypothetical protein
VALPSHAAAGLDSCWDLGRFAQHLQYKKRKNRNPCPSIIITQNRDLAFTIEKILPAPFPKNNKHSQSHRHHQTKTLAPQIIEIKTKRRLHTCLLARSLESTTEKKLGHPFIA